MRRKILAALALVLGLSMTSAAPTSADAPVYGEMDLQFNLAWPGPQDEVPDWIGTIEIDGEEYGMAFFATGSGKPFAANPSTSVHFFEEIWKIYEDLDYAFNSDGELTEFVEGPVLLWGYDRGITNMVNSKYHMSGSVEDATGAFEHLRDRPVFMSGVIEWYPFPAPQYAPGTLRVN